MVTPGLRAAAERELAALRAHLAPADRERIASWLEALGRLVAKPATMTAAEAAAKVRAYAALLRDTPAGCFTADSLRAAARRFVWWPSFAEVASLLDGIAAGLRQRAARCEAILRERGTGADDAPRRGPRTLGAEAEAALARLRAGLADRPHASGARGAARPRGYLRRTVEALAGLAPAGQASAHAGPPRGDAAPEAQRQAG